MCGEVEAGGRVHAWRGMRGWISVGGLGVMRAPSKPGIERRSAPHQRVLTAKHHHFVKSTGRRWGACVRAIAIQSKQAGGLRIG